MVYLEIGEHFWTDFKGKVGDRGLLNGLTFRMFVCLCFAYFCMLFLLFVFVLLYSKLSKNVCQTQSEGVIIHEQVLYPR